jgi:hypothetical protein
MPRQRSERWSLLSVILKQPWITGGVRGKQSASYGGSLKNGRMPSNERAALSEDLMYSRWEGQERDREIRRVLKPELQQILERLADPELCGVHLHGLNEDDSRSFLIMVGDDFAQHGCPNFLVFLSRVRDAGDLGAELVDAVARS